MKFKQKLLTVSSLAGLGICFSGCAAIGIGTLADLVPSLVPSVDVTNVNVNNNEINCYPGKYFTSDYCSIPLPKFISLSSEFANPFGSEFLFYPYQSDNSELTMHRLTSKKTIDELNTLFLKNYPESKEFSSLPISLQTIYTNMKTQYIPKHDYQNLYNSYVYLYTMSALYFATDDCNRDDNSLKHVDIKTYTLYKAFSIQYANNLLYYIYPSVDGKYNSESALFDGVYKEITKINPSRLTTLADNIYEKTVSLKPLDDWNNIFSESGISFGNAGTFSCSINGGTLYRYGYQYFGTHTQGIDLRVSYKINNVLKQIKPSENQVKITD